MRLGIIALATNIIYRLTDDYPWQNNFHLNSYAKSKMNYFQMCLTILPWFFDFKTNRIIFHYLKIDYDVFIQNSEAPGRMLLMIPDAPVKSGPSRVACLRKKNAWFTNFTFPPPDRRAETRVTTRTCPAVVAVGGRRPRRLGSSVGSFGVTRTKLLSWRASRRPSLP